MRSYSTRDQTPFSSTLTTSVAQNARRPGSVARNIGHQSGIWNGRMTRLFEEYLSNKLNGPVTIVSPDSGGVKRATKFATHLDAEVAFVYKRRRADVRNEVTASEVVGDVAGRHCVIIDDIIDTAGTVAASADLLIKKGALSVMVVATHGVLSGPAVERLQILIQNSVTNRLHMCALKWPLPG